MNKFLPIGFLIICLAALLSADCPDQSYYCYDLQGKQLGAVFRGSCLQGLKCRLCGSAKYYIDECRKYWPTTSSFSPQSTMCRKF